LRLIPRYRILYPTALERIIQLVGSEEELNRLINSNRQMKKKDISFDFSQPSRGSCATRVNGQPEFLCIASPAHRPRCFPEKPASEKWGKGADFAPTSDTSSSSSSSRYARTDVGKTG
jgi:hypothetical protein